MKKLLMLSMAFLSFTVSAQRKELNKIEDAVDDKEYESAIKQLKQIENTISTAKEKYQLKFYFYKACALKGTKDYTGAQKAFETLSLLEKKFDEDRYTSKANAVKSQIVNEVSNYALDLYNNKKNYEKAAEYFYLTYQLSPKDTAFAYNAAIAAQQAKKYDQALVYYTKLQEVNYSGAEVIYLLTNDKGQQVNAGSKKQSDLLLRSGSYSNPVVKKMPSKKGDIAKNVALILKTQGKTEEAIKAIDRARALNPKDDSLIFAAAEIYHNLKQVDKYKQLMKEATSLRPNDEVLFYNLGVVSANQGKIEDAVKYYGTAIRLKPSYFDAIFNMAAVILGKEKAIIDEMNNNLSNIKKYNKLAEEQKKVYKEALPYLEKADALKRSLSTVKTLKNIYESLEMSDKAKEYLALYKQMK